MWSAAVVYVANRNDALGDKSFPAFLICMGAAFAIGGITTVVRRLRRPVDTSGQTAELHVLLRDSTIFSERWPADRLAFAPLSELQAEANRCSRMIYLWQYLRTLRKADVAGLDVRITHCHRRLATIQAVMARAAP